MSMVVNYTDDKADCCAVGRNGVSKCRGISVFAWQSVLSLVPVNTRKGYTNCEIQIPLVDLPEVIRVMQAAANEYQQLSCQEKA